MNLLNPQEQNFSKSNKNKAEGEEEIELEDNKNQLIQSQQQEKKIEQQDQMISNFKEIIKVEKIHTKSFFSSFFSRDYPYRVSFSENRKLIVSGSHEGFLRIFHFDQTNKKLESLQVINNVHKGFITQIQFYQNDQYLFTSSYDKSIKIFKVEENNKTQQILQELQNLELVFDKAVWDIQVMPNIQILGACSGDQQIKLYDLNPLFKNNQPIEIFCKQIEHSGLIKSLSFSNDNLLCCCASYDTQLSLFEVDLNSTIKFQQILRMYTKVQFLQSKTFNEQMNQQEQSQKILKKKYILLTVSWDNSLKVLSFEAEINSLKQGTLTILQSLKSYHNEEIYNMMMAKYLVQQNYEEKTENYLIATVSLDDTVKISNLNLNLAKSQITSNIINEFSTSGHAQGVHFSSDGKFVIIVDEANTLSIFQNQENYN